MVPAALGTDTLGSLRIPSALCGTSTIKATHGRVPIDGVIALAPTLDHAGPMARTIADCRRAARRAGGRARQVTPLLPPPAARSAAGAAAGPRPLEGLTVALTDRPRSPTLDPDVADGLEAARAAVRAARRKGRRARGGARVRGRTR